MIYLPEMVDKIKDTIEGLKGNWQEYEAFKTALSSNIIVESGGSAASGYYMLYGDGTQECWAEVKAIYFSSSYVSVTWTYPKPFYSEPEFVGATIVSPNLRGSTALTNLDLGPPFIRSSSGTSVTIRVSALGGKSWGEGDEIYLKVMALGRWKA